jgi:tripeptide aminopeptidase
MLGTHIEIDKKLALGRLMHFLTVPGITGHEKAIGAAVIEELRSIGVPRKAMRYDDANKHMPVPTETGNLVVHLPGTERSDRLMFSTHLDTVPLCAGARPVRRGDRIEATGQTALGGDNRTGVACLVTLVQTLLENNLPHPPLTLLFTVREESGLWGARFVDVSLLRQPAYCFNVDGRSPSEVTIGAVGAERWQAEIHGKAAHAGVHPEKGISASLVASLALADVYRQGFFGQVHRNGRAGTSNVGSIGDERGQSAGSATNVVTDYAIVKGEARSHHPRMIRDIVSAYRLAFQKAARGVRNDEGKRAGLKFSTRLDYSPFKLKLQSPAVQHAMQAAQSVGLVPKPRTTNGGLDANWLVRHGIPTVTIGAGQNNGHSIGEYIELEDFHNACRVVLAMATAPF